MLFLKTYIRRIFILTFLYSTSRIFLYYNNIDSFTQANIFEFLEGIRFDISAILYINIPFFILLLLPLNIRNKKYYKTLINLTFYLTNIPFIILNNIDIEYFRFTQKRSTTDFLQLLQLGSDIKNLIPVYIKKFWPITLFSIIQIWILIKIKKIPSKKIKYTFKTISASIIIFLTSSIILIIGARGGIQLKPINPINAGELSNSKNSGLILNTPFCLLQSTNKNKLIKYNYFNKKEINSIYRNIIKNNASNKIEKKNIIILIMESYAKEFVGFYNNKGYTPFLDSLMHHSLVFTNAYANGVKSIDALPAITASIPTLMDNPFITSSYAQNNFESIASLLKKEQYETSFYHGGNRGTMGFYSFCKKAGFENYFGKEEYNIKKHEDGVWGVYDEPFFHYFYTNLKSKKEPFFCTFFSLSSHLPFTLPKDYIERKNIKKIGIRETITYSDYAMSKFFKKAKEEDWFKNTIFIITADHTSPIRYNNKYKNKVGRYAIPIIIFKGDSTLKGKNNNIVQQIDIMPTLLNMINYNKDYFTFGKSMFSNNEWAINHNSGRYQFITQNGIIVNKGEEYNQYQDWELKNRKTINEKDINLLKAIKQTFNNVMIKNNMIHEN